MIHVLFVCLGNICRSPLAEGLFLSKVQAGKFDDRIQIDSCGTGGWHAGELPDSRSRDVAAHYGIDLPSRARKLHPDDFSRFHYMMAMDRSNKQDLEEQRRFVQDPVSKIYLMREFDPEGKGKDVPDPYYGGPRGFYEVYDMLDRSTDAFLQHLIDEHNL